MQVLYQMDLTSDFSDKVLNDFWVNRKEEVEPEIKQFTSELVEGIRQERESIDSKIAKYAKNWELKRMAIVDRNILRQACYELLYRPDIPYKVAINEAIDLAKRFSGEEAGKFVNGILDKIRLKALEKK